VSFKIKMNCYHFREIIYFIKDKKLEFLRLGRNMFVSLFGVVKVFGWVDSCNTKYNACKTI